MEVTLNNLQISNSFLVLRRLGSKVGLSANVMVFLANTESLLQSPYQNFDKVRVSLLKQYGVMLDPKTAEYGFEEIEQREKFDKEFDKLCDEIFTFVVKKVQLNKLLENGLELSANDILTLNWLIDYNEYEFN